MERMGGWSGEHNCEAGFHMRACVRSKLLQSCLSLCEPLDRSWRHAKIPTIGEQNGPVINTGNVFSTLTVPGNPISKHIHAQTRSSYRHR